MKRRILSMCLAICLLVSCFSVCAFATQNRYYNFASVELSGSDANKILQVANAQLGKTGSNLGYSENWCADFVCDCARLAGISSSVIPYEYSSHGNCEYLRKYMLNNCGAYSVATPEAGDLIFFDWDHNSSDPYPIDHVAIVSAYNSSTRIITYIGGNQKWTTETTVYTSVVSKGTISLSSTDVSDVVRPNYDKSATPGKPALTGMSDFYPSGKEITLSWNATSNTTHYNLYVTQKDSSGAYVYYQNYFYANSGDTYTFPDGDYKVVLQSTNSNAYTADGSTWAHTNGDAVYFTVGPITATLEGVSVPAEIIQGTGTYISGVVNANMSINWAWVGVQSDDGTYSNILDSGHIYPGAKTFDITSYANNLDFASLPVGDYSFTVHCTPGGEYHVPGRYYFSVISEADTSSSPVAEMEYDGHRYELFDYHMSWTEAAAFCEARGGRLVSITTAAENNAVLGLTTNGTSGIYYIGCSDDAIEGTWSWSSQEDFDYNAWDPSAPEPTNGDGEDYGALIAKAYAPNKQPGEWIDTENKRDDKSFYGYYNCGFICEYDNECVHDYVSSVTPPTCTEQGYTTHTCECGDSYVDTYVDATGHSYNAVVTEPTCVSTGFTTYTCSECGDSYVENHVEPVQHAWDEGVVTTEPSCTTFGVKTYTCINCGETYTEGVKPLDHVYESVVVEPDCTAQGHTTHTCSACGDSYKDSYVDATDHLWNAGVVTTPPTEETDGVRTYTCSACGETKTEIIPAVVHVYDEGIVTQQPTCTEMGVLTYTCTDCGESYTEVIPAKGHSYDDGTSTAPGCTEQGYTTYSCMNCNYSYTDDFVDSMGHSYKDIVTSPTCTELGYTTHACVKCGSSYVNNYTNATGHNYKSKVTHPACTEQGYTTHTCTKCNDSYVDTYTDARGHGGYKVVVETLPTCTEKGTSHTICISCGEIMPGKIRTPATGHSWDEGVVTTPATEETDGVRTYTCSACGETRTEVIPAIVHIYDEGVVTTAPTCTEKGVKTFTCGDCGKTYTQEVEALGHSYGASVTAPTCTEQGYTTHTCIACGDSYKDSYVNAVGHNYKETVTAPTCTQQGCTTHTCSACGDSFVDSYVSPTGHSYDNGIITVKAKYMTPGEKTFTCADCGHSYTEEVARLTVPFTDVEEGKFYYTPMLWALDMGVTAGTTKTTFSPDGDCTRAQVVTFLWRAAGKPEPTTSSHPFTDVNPKAYYYKAMLWAVENGITLGTTPTTFAPDDTCTRGQVVTFLWRAQGNPAASTTEHNFTDVRSNGFYYKAMLWAVENRITMGVTSSEFKPENTCTRGQVVTFLYRVYN